MNRLTVVLTLVLTLVFGFACASSKIASEPPFQPGPVAGEPEPQQFAPAPAPQPEQAVASEPTPVATATSVAPGIATTSTAPRSRDLSAEEREVRRTAVDVRTDRGRAYGRARRPEDLKEGEYFVVSMTDNLYATSRQLTATGTDPAKPGHTELIPKNGKPGRFEAGKRVFIVKRKAGAPKPMPGVPDKLWDYTEICSPECGCQPVDLMAWQMQDPPPLMVVTYDHVVELMRRVGALEGRMATAEQNISEIKALSVQTLPPTWWDPGTGPILQSGGIVSGNGNLTCRMVAFPNEKAFYELRGAGKGVKTFGSQSVSGDAFRRQFVANATEVSGGVVVAECSDSVGNVAFGQPLNVPVPPQGSIWTNPWTYIGAGTALGLVYYLATRGDDEPEEGGPGHDPLPMLTATNAYIAGLERALQAEGRRQSKLRVSASATTNASIGSSNSSVTSTGDAAAVHIVLPSATSYDSFVERSMGQKEPAYLKIMKRIDVQLSLEEGNRGAAVLFNFGR